MTDRIELMGLNSQWDFVTMQGDESIDYSLFANGGTSLLYAPVKLTGEKTVGLAEDGDEIYGTLSAVESDGVCRIGKGNIQEFRDPDDVTITAGAAVVAGPNNTIKAGTAPAGSGTFVGKGVINGMSVAYVDFK